MIGTIYIVLNTVNNKKYIGQTIMTLNRRKSSHLLSAKHHYDNLYFHRAINKYGEEAFEWTVLETIKNVGDKWIPTKRSPLYGWQFEAIEKYEF